MPHGLGYKSVLIDISPAELRSKSVKRGRGQKCGLNILSSSWKFSLKKKDQTCMGHIRHLTLKAWSIFNLLLLLSLLSFAHPVTQWVRYKHGRDSSIEFLELTFSHKKHSSSATAESAQSQERRLVKPKIEIRVFVKKCRKHFLPCLHFRPDSSWTPKDRVPGYGTVVTESFSQIYGPQSDQPVQSDFCALNKRSSNFCLINGSSGPGLTPEISSSF